MRALLAAALVGSIGCGTPASTPGPTDQPAVEPEPAVEPGHDVVEPAFEVACPDLPSERPADLVIRFELHDYERPEALQRYAIVPADRGCPRDPMPPHLLTTYAAEVCVPIDDAAFDALHRELAPLRAVRTRALPEHPHRGGSVVLLAWGDRSCRVGDVSHDVEVAPDDRAAYAAVDGAVRTALRTALGLE